MATPYNNRGSRIGAEALRRQAAERARVMRDLMDQGEAFKRAAFRAGVSVRTARRYRQSWERV